MSELRSKTVFLLAAIFQVVFISPWNSPAPRGQEGNLGTSAWYAPGAAAAQVAAAVIHDQKKMITCSALLEGEYGEKDLCIGVPCILGRNGIEKVVEFDLNAEEKELFAKSAAAVHNTNAALA